MNKKLPLRLLIARTLVKAAVGLLYRMRIVDRRNCPRKGAALLVCNHVSFADALLVASASPRIVHFLMSRSYYNLPILHGIFEYLGAIPVSMRDKPKAVLRSLMTARKVLEEGKVLCIFAEGEITRHGQMLRFKKGFEKIVKGLDVPVVPVHLDRLWGSFFSFKGGRAIFKMPKRIPYPVTVSFGAPLRSDATAQRVRQSIEELGSESFRIRLAEKASLPVELIRRAGRCWWRLAAADSGGRKLTFGGFLAEAFALARAFDRDLGQDKQVGVALPPSVDGALAIVGLSLSGRVPVPLNLSFSKQAAEVCCAKAGVTRVIISRGAEGRLSWRPDRPLYIEDLPRPGFMERLSFIAQLAIRDPETIRRRWAPKAPLDLEALAAVLFTSGSTGTPKGVMLSQGNVLSNVEAISQVYATTPSDRILGILALHHAMGFTGTLWLPLLMGIGVVFHDDPTDVRGLARLVRGMRATIMIATPSMLSAYLRRVPARAFRSLRLVIAGAEKLREELAAAWLEKYRVLPLEGYGCTELSPVATVNIPDVDWERVHQKGAKVGTIGQPLPGVTIKTVCPETWEPTPEGVPGLLLVKGPNVMKGYVGEPEKTARAIRDGYYVTGDVAVIDPDAFVTITDRLSRFSKIGGELVPHRALELKLQELSGAESPSFLVTSIPGDIQGERLVVLFTDGGEVELLRRGLAGSGFPKPWIPGPTEFHRVEKLPFLPSGKADLAALKQTALRLDGERASRESPLRGGGP